MKMLVADPPIVFKRIIDKKSGKPRLPVTRENIVEEVSTRFRGGRFSFVASDEKLSPDSIAPPSEWTDSCL
jgi:hypothetical protein